MKKFIGLFIVLMFCATICVPVISENIGSSQEMMIKEDVITFSKPSINIINDKISISISGSNTILQQPGKPLLPIYKKTYFYPLGTQIESINISPQSTSIFLEQVRAYNSSHLGYM